LAVADIFQNFNKEIYMVMMAVTTRCNLNCAYCYVAKDGREMPLETALRTVDFVLRSPGQKKLLQIYGGEPFLCFDLVKTVIERARALEKQSGKTLVLSVATNGTLIQKSSLLFLKENRARLAVSIDGRQAFHDQARKTRNGKSVYQKIMDHIPLIMDILGPARTYVLFGVLPQSAPHVYDNYRYLERLGFDCFNFEKIVSDQYRWNSDQAEQFKTNFLKVMGYIDHNIPKGKFIFLKRLNTELDNQSVSRYLDSGCPFWEDLVIYPDGEMTFSPFLVNLPDPRKQQYVIGNISGTLHKQYRDCVYDAASVICRECLNNYTGINDRSQGGETSPFNHVDDVHRLRYVSAVYFARKIISEAQRDPIYADYMREAGERL
jgi:sulfatase maturation enzyme AslB (radical SAM superfamily)